MRFISVFNVFVTAGAVNAAGNSTVATEITNALKHGDFVGAAMDILTLGDCDLANVAGNYLPYSDTVKWNVPVFNGN